MTERTSTGLLATIRLLPRAGRWHSAAFGLVVLWSGVQGILLTLATGALVAAVAEASGAGVDSPGGQRLLTALVAVGALFVAGRALDPLQGALTAALARRFERQVQLMLFRAAGGPTGIAHLEDARIADRLAVARGETGGLPPSVAVMKLTQVVPPYLQAAGSAVLLAGFWWWAPLLMVAGVLVERLWVARELDTAAVGLAEQAGPLRRAGYFRNVALEAATAKELRIFGLADWALERFRTLWQRAMEPAWRARQRHGRLMAAAMVAVTGAYVVVAAAIALAGVRGEIDVGQVAVFLAAAAGVGAVAWTADPEWGLRMASRAVLQATALERELGAARPGQASSPVQHRRPAAGRPHREIRFEGVSFRYPGSETDVLRGLDLVIPAGRSLAIVGQNGAGKTTLVKLLARLYEPGGGRLTVDGEPLAVYDVASWRARLAVIFQDFARYELPARDNVGFGCPRLLQRPGIGEAGGTAAIERAIQRAGASEVLAALPAGLDTVLSRRYRGGADLSGGEWQRLALARCFAAVEGGAGVLVLDEPTAALDVRAEAALFERFLELTAGLTTVLISHRFSTVRRAERIVVVELGRIVEQGSHEALLARGGRYATMFRLQAARFQGAESAAGAAGGDDDV